MSYTATETTLPAIPNVHSGTGTHQATNWVVDPASVPGSAAMAFSGLDVQVTTKLFAIPNVVIPNWFGVALPNGLSDFTRPHIFFHPTPGQAGYAEGDYKNKTGKWPELFYYMERLGYQLDGAHRNQILIMPFMTESAKNGGILPANWQDIVTQILTLVRADLNPSDTSPLSISQLAVSSFSAGIVYSNAFRTTGLNIASVLAEVWDFDGRYSTYHAISETLQSTATVQAIKYDQITSADPSAYHVPLARWTKLVNPPTSSDEVHGLIRDFMFLDAASVTGVGSLIKTGGSGSTGDTGTHTGTGAPPAPSTHTSTATHTGTTEYTATHSGTHSGSGTAPSPGPSPSPPAPTPHLGPSPGPGPAPHAGPTPYPGYPPLPPSSPMMPFAPTAPLMPFAPTPSAPFTPYPEPPFPPYPQPPLPPVPGVIPGIPMQAGAQSGDCCCSASVVGMVSLVSTTAQTAITAITAIAATTGSGASVSLSPAASTSNMASLAGSVNAGAGVGYASSLVKPPRGDTGASIQNVSYVSSNFGDPNWVEPALPTTFAQNDAGLLAELSEARKYEFFIHASSERAGLLPSIVAGIGSRESGWGLSRLLKPRGPGGTGDFAPRRPTALRSGPLPPDGGGFGRGLMQIDWDEQPFARTGNWSDPAANIDCGCQILRQNLNHISRHTNLQLFDLLRAAIAAYNAGPGNVLRVISIQGINAVDSVTTGGNYSTDVLNRAGWFQAHGFWRQVATGGADGRGILV